MASLNVSDVLDDPDFWSEAVLVRALSEVTDCGLAQNLPDAITIQGVIWQGGGKGLVQDGIGNWVEGDLMILTRHPIDTGNRDRATDGVIFQGLPYAITNAQLWAFGDGFTQATGKLATINPSQMAGATCNGGNFG